jgi:hypothetical protein
MQKDSLYNVENAIVKQKDEILEQCLHGSLRTALVMLDIVRPVWLAVGYGYKGDEIALRIFKMIDVMQGERIKPTKTQASLRDHAVECRFQYLNAPTCPV